MPKESAHTSLSNDNEVVVDIASGATAETEPAVARRGTEPLTRFRRRLERSRSRVEEHQFGDTEDDDDDLRLQLMLLREENARLKAARHKPRDQGSMIDRMRALAESGQEKELLDESWSLLAECLALREGLDQACVEIQAAIHAVRERLGTLGVAIETIAPDQVPPLLPDRDVGQHEDATSLSA